MISLGFSLLGHLGDLVVVDQVVVLAHLVGHRLEPLARLVGRAAVGQVAAGGQVHAHEGVARLQQGHEHRLVGLGARVRLDVGEGRSRTAAWRARWRGSRPRRHTRSRRSSACRDSPRRTCWSGPSPAPPAPPWRRCSPRRSARSAPAGASVRASSGSSATCGVGSRPRRRARRSRRSKVRLGTSRVSAGRGTVGSSWLGRARRPRRCDSARPTARRARTRLARIGVDGFVAGC